MSRPIQNRPKTSVEAPIRSCTGGFREADRDDPDSLQTASSARRLPSLSGAKPLLSRQPLQWTEEPGAKRTAIGRGAIGTVFLATFNKRPVAVKQVGGEGPGNRQPGIAYQRELRSGEFLLTLRHENVVRYLQFDTSTQPGVLFVVMELIEGSNLAELRRERPFSDTETTSVIAQTCCGLDYLHSHGPPIVHRDVKGANIMLTLARGHRLLVKLIDLGFAILCPEGDKDQQMAKPGEGQPMIKRSLVGTDRFIAPEVYERHAYSAKSDVFALGCTLFELVRGQPPHADKSNDMAVCYAVCYQPMPDLPPACCDSRLADLYRACTRRDPGMRPTAGEILGCSFIAAEALTSV